MALALKHREIELTAVLEPPERRVVGSCPEFALAVEGETQQEALEELVDAAIEYSEEYLEEPKVYAASPNRSHHLPFVRAVAAAGDRDAVHALFLS